MTKTLRPVNRFDEETGRREVVMEFKCPNNKFWRFGHYEIYVNTYTHLKKFEEPTDD